MDSFLEKLEALSRLAARRGAPAPLDAGKAMARIRLLGRPEEAFPVPLGFFAGGAAAAAALAVLATLAAAAGWSDPTGPAVVLDSVTDVMGIML